MQRTFNILLWAFLLFLIGVILFNVAEGLSYLSLTVLSPTVVGVLLVILAFACFILEMMTPGFGLFTAIGVVALTVGSIILFYITPWLIALIDVAAAITVFVMVNSVLKSQRLKITTGHEGMVGKTAEARETLNPIGMVLFEGELWKAVSDEGVINPGEIVSITCVESLTLHVLKNKDGGKC